jgi:hypothetical protein
MLLSNHAICRRAQELLADCACSSPASGGATRAAHNNVSLCNMLPEDIRIVPSADGPKSYWLIVPAASQPVEVLPRQVMIICHFATCDVTFPICRWAEELLANRTCSCPASGGAARAANYTVSLCHMLCHFQTMPSAAEAKSYWLIVPAASQPVRAPPSQLPELLLLYC